jgi:hypothetical protein
MVTIYLGVVALLAWSSFEVAFRSPGAASGLAELQEFALNPAFAPTPVFTAHANDQAAQLL